MQGSVRHLARSDKQQRDYDILRETKPDDQDGSTG